jgi:hypothetical protein
LKIYIFLLLTLSVGHNLWAQSPTNKITLKGFVIGADTNNTIPLANILKKPSGERFISNRYGGFSIQVEETDTLVFSVIGYHNLIFPVKKYVQNNLTDPIRVKLKPMVYRLKQAEVNYNQKKRDSVARQAARVLKTSPLLNNYYHYGSWVSGSSGSVVSDMFASGNEKLQEYNKVLRLIELYHQQEKVDERYTDDLIMRSTGLKEDQVLEFKKYCNLPNYFVLNSNDYDLVLAIRACHSDFKRQAR